MVASVPVGALPPGKWAGCPRCLTVRWGHLLESLGVTRGDWRPGSPNKVSRPRPCSRLRTEQLALWATELGTLPSTRRTCRNDLKQSPENTSSLLQRGRISHRHDDFSQSAEEVSPLGVSERCRGPALQFVSCCLDLPFGPTVLGPSDKGGRDADQPRRAGGRPARSPPCALPTSLPSACSREGVRPTRPELGRRCPRALRGPGSDRP